MVRFCYWEEYQQIETILVDGISAPRSITGAERQYFRINGIQMIYTDESVYLGQVRNMKMSGKGTLYSFKNKEKYVGNFSEGKFNG